METEINSKNSEKQLAMETKGSGDNLDLMEEIEKEKGLMDYFENWKENFLGEEELTVDEEEALKTQNLPDVSYLSEYSWETDEFVYQEKGKRWFWMMAVFFVTLMIIGILLQNYFMTVLFFAIMVLSFINANRKPNKIQIAINDEGIWVRRNFYHFYEIENFSLHNPFRSDLACLNLKLRSGSWLPIRIPLGKEANPIVIKAILIRKLEEDTSGVGFVDWIGYILKL